MDKKILDITASELVRSSMEAYAKEVIEDRSLPDFRDGLKISQRRILYYMWSEGILPSGNFKASANVVGGVLGRLHPHGDSSCYDTLVKLNSNIISPVHGDGDGWGSIHTEASAMRYTKTKLSTFGEHFCRDIHVADYTSTYAGDWQEPIIIPAPIPYALLAGTSGIAVAVATSIPSHNLTELVNTFIAILHGEQDIDKLIGTTLLAPESKTGGVVVSSLDEIRDVYRKGKGRIRWRCGYKIIFNKINTEWSLVITSIPEAFPLSSWLTKMKNHAQNGMLQIENESCSEDLIRFVITFNNVAFFYDVIEPSLYCNDTYNFNLISKVGDQITDISLHHHSFLSWVDTWLTWREGIEIKLVKDQIDKLEYSLYREKIKLWAIQHIDKIIACLKNSQKPIQDLMEEFGLEQEQSKIIAQIQLQTISKLSKDKQERLIKQLEVKVEAEHRKLKKPKSLVEKTLQSLLPYDKGRIATIDYDDSSSKDLQTVLNKSDGQPNYWAIETSKPKTLHQIGSELPLRKRILNPYLNIVNAQQGLITVTEKGEVKRWNISDLVEKDISCPYVNILSLDSEQLIISLNNGLWGNYLMKQKAVTWTTKLIHTGEDKVLSAVGLDKGDLLWVYSSTHLEAVTCNWETFKRSNKVGWKIRGGKDVKLLSIPKDYSLVINSSRSYSFSELVRPSQSIIKEFLLATSYYLYNPKDNKQNLLCICRDGTRLCVTGKDINPDALDLVQTYLI